MTSEEASYIAGIVDGEGSISFNRSHFGDSTRHIIYNPRVRITNTNRELLDWICAVVGIGKVRPMKMYESNTKQAYDWYLNGKKCAEFLKLIIPYLRVKRLQAEIVFKYCETLLDRKDCIKGRALPEETLSYREHLRKQMVQANNRGGLYN